MQDDSTKNAKNQAGNWLDDWLSKSQADASEQSPVDEAELFQQAMKDVTPIRASDKVRPAPAAKKITIRDPAQRPHINDVFSDAPVEDCPEQLLYCRDGITPATLKKLRQGKFQIDHSIDLHGMTVAAARSYLLEFLGECDADGSRCILIVHGKGFSSPDRKPVIKPMVNRWLREVPAVLAFCSAARADGGSGAAYVLLKRKR